jgi:Shwachman-Bodian-Diamond syndrome (SBDS) protein
MANRGVSSLAPLEHPAWPHGSGCHRETDLDEVMQISNVFMNVSKGQVASSEDLKKAFAKTDVNEIVKEVGYLIVYFLVFSSLLFYRRHHQSHFFHVII